MTDPFAKPKKPLKSSLSKSPKMSAKSNKSSSRGGSSSSDDDDVVMPKPRHVSGVQSRITAKSLLRTTKSSIKRSVDVDYGGGSGTTSPKIGFQNPSFIPENIIEEDDVAEKHDNKAVSQKMTENPVLSDDSR